MVGESSSGMKYRKIPQETIIRLAYYLRALNFFHQEGIKITSSRRLAEILRINPHQVRKDLSFFGQFGKKGVGYNVDTLRDSLREILGLKHRWYACIVGFGNLAKAISLYRGFYEQGIIIKVGFDIVKRKVNKKYGNVYVYHIDEMPRVVKREKISLGIITTPQNVAQEIGEKLVKCGVLGILNFSPIRLKLPPDIVLKDVELAAQLFYLTYHLKRKRKGGK